jgi:hypothetical protein
MAKATLSDVIDKFMEKERKRIFLFYKEAFCWFEGNLMCFFCFLEGAENFEKFW